MTMELPSLEQRIAALEDQLEIRQLVARFVFAVDDRRFSEVAEMFTAGGRFRYINGTVDLNGRRAIVEHFEARYLALGLTNHVTHDHVVDFVGPGRAHGRVASHVEVCRANGQAMVTATRFDDVYEREETATGSVWRFAERALSVLYYLPAAQYPALVGQQNRNRSGQEPRPADIGE